MVLVVRGGGSRSGCITDMRISREIGGALMRSGRCSREGSSRLGPSLSAARGNARNELTCTGAPPTTTSSALVRIIGAAIVTAELSGASVGAGMVSTGTEEAITYGRCGSTEGRVARREATTLSKPLGWAATQLLWQPAEHSPNRT